MLHILHILSILHSAPAEVTFHNELAHAFQEQVNQAQEHPIIVIISSCKSTFIQGSCKYLYFPVSNVFKTNTITASNLCCRWTQINKQVGNKVLHQPWTWSSGGIEKRSQVCAPHFIAKIKCKIRSNRTLHGYRLANWRFDWALKYDNATRTIYSMCVFPPAKSNIVIPLCL